jgi:hypothetical protein
MFDEGGVAGLSARQSDKPVHEAQAFEHDPGAGTVEGDPGQDLIGCY